MSSINGLLLLNKTPHKTSHDMVHACRKIFQQKSVGHAGTLDPLADGLLVILLGKATKLSSYLLNKDKRYFVKLKLGLQTDTLDIEGQVLKEKQVSVTQKEIEKVIQESNCALDLLVPYFSAVKIQGKRLYKYARQNQEVELPTRKMTFYDLKIDKIETPDVSFSISCKKGAYIRALVNHIGEKLGCYATLTELTRISSEPFHLESSLNLNEVEEKLELVSKQDEQAIKQALQSSFVYFSSCLKEVPSIEVTERDAFRLFSGQIPPHLVKDLESQQIVSNKEKKELMIQFVRKHHLVALVGIKPFKRLKILKAFIYK